MAKEQSDLLAPRLSATMIIVRAASAAAAGEVLAITRSKQLRVLPGFMVFPGGVLDPLDIDVASSLPQAMRNSTPSLFTMQEADFKGEIVSRDLLYWSLFVAGVRELFEETGIYMGAPRKSWTELQEIREALLQGQGSEWKKIVITESSFYPFRYVGRRVTPIQVKHRFDTHYFIVQVPHDIAVYPSPDEVESVLWSAPDELLTRFGQDEFHMAPPTVDALTALSRHASLADLMANAVMAEQSNDDARINHFLRQLSAN
jgi:8-oxo-dGTP pyrophosphatase MutT (NUDIX family)